MPPLVQFQWGGIISFPAYVSQVNVKYTRFASNGVPIRAVCTVNLEEMPPGNSKQNPTSGVLAVERVHTMVAGDHLALVAYKEYGSAAMWRPLAAYNGIDDPMRIAERYSDPTARRRRTAGLDGEPDAHHRKLSGRTRRNASYPTI